VGARPPTNSRSPANGRGAVNLMFCYFAYVINALACQHSGELAKKLLFGNAGGNI
jgi:hypothetical protein